MKSICNYEKCTGCGACQNVCPKGAIVLKDDSCLGFQYPVIDHNLCIDCGVCQNVCPAIIEMSKRRPFTPYAAYSLDEGVRFNSSSGGVFTELANCILDQNGVVVGAAFENNELQHVIVEGKKDLWRLRGSKYLQSRIGNVFRDVKNYLDRNKCVLFSGTPCQIKGLYLFLQRDYTNLYTIDVFCHGVPSPGIYRRYMDEKRYIPKTRVNFRDKTLGWNNYNFTYKTLNGVNSSLNDTDTYFRGFISNLFLRESCYGCTFNRIEKRCADISIGDFWGCERFYPELSDNKGVSAVLVFSEKGDSLFNRVRQNLFVKEVKLEEIEFGNPVLLKSSVKHKKADWFSNAIKNRRIGACIEESLGMNKNVAILNHAFSQDNYGALMVAYSMEKIVAQLGYYPETINIKLHNENLNSHFQDFKRKFLHMSESVLLDSDFTWLNRKYDTFIVGSDQVWRNWWRNDSIVKKWFLDFADSTKNLIAYAASFGINKFEGSPGLKRSVRELLKSFSKISVREYTGVNIVRRDFNQDALVVLDPTLLIEKGEYAKIIKSENIIKPSCKFLAYMIFPNENFDTDKTRRLVHDLSESLKLRTERVLGTDKTVAQWLYSIQNADFVVTDSFHGVMFSIIFKKQFICLINKLGGADRFLTVAKNFSLRDRFFYDEEDIDIDTIIQKKINYEVVDKKLCELRKISIKYLQDALATCVVDNGRRHKSKWCKIVEKTSKKKEIFLLGFIPLLKIKYKKKHEVFYLFFIFPIYKRGFL